MSSVLVSAMTGFCSRILGAAAPLGALFFLFLMIFGSGPFWGRAWGFGCACWGFEGWHPSAWGLMRGREAAAI